MRSSHVAGADAEQGGRLEKGSAGFVKLDVPLLPDPRIPIPGIF